MRKEAAIAVLDGAVGTELGSLGVATDTPLFSAAALLDPRGLEALRSVHREYLAAGARTITASTFRTNPRALRAAGLPFPELARRAVRVAREEADRVPGAQVAGSLAPVEDCYRPELRPPPALAREEHSLHARALVDAGCDLLLVETVCAADEGLAAVEAAAGTGVPVWVAAMVMPDGRMKSGDDLARFFLDARERGARAALLNCVPCDGVDLGLAAARASGLPFGAYAHMGDVDPNAGWPASDVLSPERYAERAKQWLDRGATIVGGCCGTTPAHVEALAGVARRRP